MTLDSAMDVAPRELAPNLWIFDRPLSVFGLRVGARMTVIRLDDGSLFLHSPVPPTAETRAALDAWGPVRSVVAPSKIHHFYIGAYRETYPEACLYAAPGLPEKRPNIAFDEELSSAAPPAWAGEIEQELFAGIPYMNEVAFFHAASRSLVLTDLAFNIYESDSFLTRTWFKLAGTYGRFGVAAYVRRLVRDREAARRSLERILAWDFDRVIVSHGIVLQRSGRRMLREAFGWLLD